ncbi:MAG: hypothetical protein KGD63_04080 [Candidatus Lokiarchaeota archaeon]|nr:hypothetical protein [Candidatus Lokiarchaeota archaeon]
MSQKTATLGLIFGILGLGLGGYIFVESKILPMLGIPSGDSIKNTWYIGNVVASPITGSIEYLFPFSLIITVNSGENMYGSFTGYTLFNVGVAEVYLYVYIDGIYSSGDYMRITRTDTSGDERYSFAFQWFINTISAGTHNISMWGRMAGGTGYLYTGNLLIQTLI